MAAWLCGTDGRGKLILDALPDRYFIAEVSDEAALTDDDWASGEAAIAFTCQPFAYAVSEDGVTVQTSANAAKARRSAFRKRRNHARVPCHMCIRH